MELKLVYRVLRKISDWTLAGFFSEVYIEGHQNVARDGPLIMYVFDLQQAEKSKTNVVFSLVPYSASSHHNEIIDIATLAATIPHRRHVSFWAKSTMFANPISRTILLSSGSIPVKRNPNNGNSGQSSPDTTASTKANTNSSAGSLSSHQATLFRETSTALASGHVIGVFPEGTSYTEPSIVQVMSGAAWAAVEYARWEREREVHGVNGKQREKRKGLVILPVGIVYTDKSQYQSRVRVEYGTPITIDSYTDELFGSAEGDPDVVSRTLVRKIMGEVEKQMFAMTINAPDWDTLYAARTARDILWGDEKNIPLNDFVHISQTLVKMFSPSNSPNSPKSLPSVKRSLTKYFALLHYTGITHPILASVSPLPNPVRTPPSSSPSVSSSHYIPPVTHALLIFLFQLNIALLHPRFFLFLPTFLVHIPAYLIGVLAARYLATRGEEEGQAQFKTIAGGFGMGIGNLGIAWWLIRWLVRLGKGDVDACLLVGRNVGGGKVENTVDMLKRFGVLLSGGEGGIVSQVKRTFGIMSFAYGTMWVLVKWHNSLVGGNYRQYKRLTASYKLLLGLLQPRSLDIQAVELEAYTKPPPPPVNPFIKRRREATAAATDSVSTSTPTSDSDSSTPEFRSGLLINSTPKAVASRKLIRHLLAARIEAEAVLGEYCRDPDVMGEVIVFLKKNRATLPVVSNGD